VSAQFTRGDRCNPRIGSEGVKSQVLASVIGDWQVGQAMPQSIDGESLVQVSFA